MRGRQARYDAKNAYLRYQWKTQLPDAGTEHQYLRFDGKEWKVYGYPKLDKPVQEGKQAGIYESRMTIMIDDGKVPQFAQQGCWLAGGGEQTGVKAACGRQPRARAVAAEGLGD